ncbi:hypothetical protein EXU85_34115 [Spirosoma sp. KCTC 42546]|uniref:DUF6934 family protein n=1 Tax=Spirosoma sp. KCTC 42546 TaxID=2520506 RepID=UPI00115707B9|nr:hypothetical protein [Spirosoma sp. KCTC 42546]QDK83371.1 hypothetical protein EXU85_34115 [Spirosoma sp. KCTC 42546]
MQHPSYSYQSNADATQFFFESIGRNGLILKAIILAPTINSSVYNLALGDYNQLSGELDDSVVSDNGDTGKIMATTFWVINEFLTKYPDRLIIFSGNTPARNRLYRMAINRGLSELAPLYSLFGFRNDAWESFDISQQYELYLIEKK